MTVEMPKGLPFSVDTWSASSKKKRHRFLTHSHSDHTVGILTHSSYPIYSTHLTKALVLQRFPQLDDSLFVGIEVGQSIIIDDPDGAFRVSALDANHCPGAVMFLFEGTFGNILHTGDCRLSPECLLSLPDKYLGKKGKKPRCHLDYVFLDCTFGNVFLDMPSKHFAIRQVINCIWKHPDAPVVYLTCDLLGQEEILLDVSRTFGSKIYVDKANNPGLFHTLKLIVPEIVSQDPSSRFHVFDAFPNLHDRARAKLKEARATFQPEPLIIRPSTQWYAHNMEFSGSGKRPRINEPVRDQSGVWHVCYSIHSSREELEWALQLLAPKWVVSTTPGCRAMELNYVKKHCFNSHIASDDPIWKLLDICVKASSVEDEAIKEVGCSMVETPPQTLAEFHLQPVKICGTQKDLFNLSPLSKRPPITLFGRARFGIEDCTFPLEETKIVSIKDDRSHFTTTEKAIDLSIQKEDDVGVEVRIGLQDGTSPPEET